MLFGRWIIFSFSVVSAHQHFLWYSNRIIGIPNKVATTGDILNQEYLRLYCGENKRLSISVWWNLPSLCASPLKKKIEVAHIYQNERSWKVDAVGNSDVFDNTESGSKTDVFLRACLIPGPFFGALLKPQSSLSPPCLLPLRSPPPHG